jgi:hypothetical protein
VANETEKTLFFERPLSLLGKVLAWAAGPGVLIVTLFKADPVMDAADKHPAGAITVGVIVASLLIALMAILQDRLSKRRDEARTARRDATAAETTLRERTDALRSQHVTELAERDQRIADLQAKVSALSAVPDPCDVALIEKFLHLLPSQSDAMGELRSAFFAGNRVSLKTADALRVLATVWADPLHQFHHAGVDQAREELVLAAREALVSANNRMWNEWERAHAAGLETPTHMSIPHEWQTTMPDRFEEAVDTMVDAWTEVIEKYDALLAEAKRARIV